MKRKTRPFGYTRKENYSQADMDNILNQHEVFLDIDGWEQENETLSTNLAIKEEEVNKLTGDFDKVSAELKPFKLNAKKTEILNDIKGANLLNDKKINDAMVLAGVNFEQDDAKSAKAKIKEFIKQEGRDEYKYVQPKEEQTPPPAKLNPAQIAGITNTNTKEKDDTPDETLGGSFNVSHGIIA